MESSVNIKRIKKNGKVELLHEYANPIVFTIEVESFIPT